jgi:hypothetical protein
MLGRPAQLVAGGPPRKFVNGTTSNAEPRYGEKVPKRSTW